MARLRRNGMNPFLPLQDEALEYSDKRCNGMLHVAIAARAEGPEELMAKRTVVSALLKHGFVLDDTNLDGKTCKDMCPASFERDMRGQRSMTAHLNSSPCAPRSSLGFGPQP